MSNYFNQIHRKIKHRKAYKENQINAEIDNTTPDTDVLEGMIKKEAEQSAIYHLNQLEDIEKQIIQLKAIQNFKLREIADMMDLSIGRVSYLLNRGLKTIGNKLNEDGIV